MLQLKRLHNLHSESADNSGAGDVQKAERASHPPLAENSQLDKMVMIGLLWHCVSLIVISAIRWRPSLQQRKGMNFGL